MKAELSRNMVKGFLDVKGTKIVNGDGNEIILSGWGLGNWLLCEGYMWLSDGVQRFDRPRRIEMIIDELCGQEYAQNFWVRFRERYITEDDIQLMASMGYNSVRIPINARLFLEEGPEMQWIDEGFELLDKCIDWCEKHSLYAFIDLHGAPGGQTGANIDDSIDDMPRLFMDRHCFDKGVALWRKLAQRYKDRWIVGGYDILNEPIRPVRHEGDTDVTHLLPLLKKFYEAAIQAIREVDEHHLVTLEGHYWASATEVFCKKYDPKMIIHFHRYACIPDIESFTPFLEAAERWQCPLWLGETGENMLEWFTAMYPLSVELGIGFNLWPWKKMECVNSPCSVTAPAGWEKIIDYAKGGQHPGYTAAQKIMDQYLENMRISQCTVNDDVTSHVFRTPGCTIRGADFDEFPGKGVSYSGLRDEGNLFGYRQNTGMEIIEKFPDIEKKFDFDCRWKRFVLGLRKGEFACYTLNEITEKSRLEVRCYCASVSSVEIYQDGDLLNNYTLGGMDEIQIIGSLRLKASARSSIKIAVASGSVEIDALITAGIKTVYH